MPPPKPFPTDKNIRHDPLVFEGEHATGTAKADRGLVENQQGAVAVASLTHATPVARRGWIDGRAADGFGNDRRHIGLLIKDIFDIAGAFEIAGTAIPVRIPQATVRVRRRDMFASGQQRADTLPEQRLPADGDGVQGSTVKGVPHGDGLEAAR